MPEWFLSLYLRWRQFWTYPYDAFMPDWYWRARLRQAKRAESRDKERQ